MKLLPSKISSLLQPMDKGAIETARKLYGKSLLHRVLLAYMGKNKHKINLSRAVHLMTLHECLEVHAWLFECKPLCTCKGSTELEAHDYDELRWAMSWHATTYRLHNLCSWQQRRCWRIPDVGDTNIMDTVMNRIKDQLDDVHLQEIPIMAQA